MKYFDIGNPFNTEAVINFTDVSKLSSIDDLVKDLKVNLEFKLSDCINIEYKMDRDDYVFGLGENTKGINKRGCNFESFCSDDPNHVPDKKSLYGAHNFLIIDNDKEKIGLFIDFPSKVIFDIGFTHKDILNIKVEGENARIYLITGDSSNAIVKKFLRSIGKSYLPPKWAFGYQQSRWSYEDSNVIKGIAEKMDSNNIPCDAIYLDIDYMEDFKNFSTDNKKFPEFKSFVSDMKEKGFRLIPIIDAGCKIEKDYSIYEEGIKNNYFCVDKNEKPFVGAVWPGKVHFPDFINPDVRKWFGDHYNDLINLGIEGFWNDMNEPAIFYSEEGIKNAIEYAASCKDKNLGIYEFFELKDKFMMLSNSTEDYKSFYHKLEDKTYNHYDLHNLYGYNMTRAAGEAFERNHPEQRFLLFSRASYVGMHRYGGIWTGDNHAWWEHLLLNIKMMPSINMCGFIYSGADIGGFNADVDSELLTRWNQFAIFTPLFRNHSVMGSRHQEPFGFDEDSLNNIRNAIKIRYSLVNFIYSEFMKHNNNYQMLFKPLAFEYKDKFVKQVEDQLLYGESLMLTPIYTQNAKGRYVYLPEKMLFWKLKTADDYDFNLMDAGHHYIDVYVDEVPTFIRKNKLVVLTESALNVDKISTSSIEIVGYVETEATYSFYSDDGISKDTNSSKSYLDIIIESVDSNIVVSHKLMGISDVKEIHYDVITSDNNRKKGVYYV